MKTQPAIRNLENGNICISVPLMIKYKRGRKRVIAPDTLNGENPDSESPTQTSLVISLAKAHAWLNLIESGRAKHMLDLADKLKLNCSYVGRVIRLACLAPDIQEAILNGSEPDGMSYTKLAAGFPDSWEEQRKLFNV
jgi:hypothetical protein